MFEVAETGRTLSKEDFAAEVPRLRMGLVNAQYDLRGADFPVLVAIAGDDRLGAADVWNRLHEWMDARYLASHAFGPLTREEEVHPPFWRFWRALPGNGETGVFLGGWAQSPVARRLEGKLDAAGFARWVAHAARFERALVDDGALVLKFWIHLPRSEHEAQLARAEKGKGRAWRVDERDWRICEEYDALLPVAEEMVRRTSSAEAPWHLVEGTDARHRDAFVAQTLLEGLTRRLEGAPAVSAPAASPPLGREPPHPSVLDAVDLSRRVPWDDYKKPLEKLQRRLFKRVDRAGAEGLRTVLVFEGWDAAGKGGVIRRITAALDARDYRVVPVAAPTSEEARHHYLWRFWRHVPVAGKLVVFDRSWYGRVLVERVEGLAAEPVWRRAYGEINDFEQQLVEADSLVLKFWLHVSPEEQLRRFRDRERTGYKKYKITDEDYRNRERWEAYEAAVHEMVGATSTPSAPWHLVAAEDKRAARLEVLETVCDALKGALKER